MSDNERNEYMRNVRWTTAIYTCCSAGSILLAMAGMYYGLKGDIKDNRTSSRAELTAAVVSINKKQDSIQHVNDMKFKDVWYVLKTPALVTQKRTNGELTFIPVD